MNFKKSDYSLAGWAWNLRTPRSILHFSIPTAQFKAKTNTTIFSSVPQSKDLLQSLQLLPLLLSPATSDPQSDFFIFILPDCGHYLHVTLSSLMAPRKQESSTPGNQHSLFLPLNSARFQHNEAAATPLWEAHDWAFSSAPGHTLSVTATPLLSPSISVIWR